MKIFISYSHEDKNLFQELVDGLAGVHFLLPAHSVWHDKLIPLASEWDEEIRAALLAADLVLLLVSPDFMKSKYIWEKELTPALARHEAKQCKVLPIILRPTAAWEKSPFGKLQAAFGGKHVDGVRGKRDKAWKEIVEGVLAMAEKFASQPAAGSGRPKPAAALRDPRIPTNHLFTGREADLQWIAETLASGRAAALLHGMGGVGKTQLAAEYARRHADDYKVVWWVTAETDTEADAGYDKLAQALNLPGRVANNAEQTRGAVLDWMNQQSGWLVVLDNAESPDALAKWWPNAPRGHLLITSRNPNWRARAAVRDVEVWPLGEAADFLTLRSGDADRAAAEKLAAALGCLPLACETAAAYVAERGCDLAGYAKRLAEQPVKYLEFLPQDKTYARTLPQVIDLSAQAVADESPLALEILRALAWLAADDIPIFLLEVWPAETAVVDAALAVLLRAALLRKTGGGFAVHRLTQEIVRAADPQPQVSAAAAIRALNKAFTGNPQNDAHLWPRYAVLLPHGEGLFALLPDPPPELWSTSRINAFIGIFLRFAKGDYSAAKIWYEKALALTEARVGPDHADLAAPLSNLGTLVAGDGGRRRGQAAVSASLGDRRAGAGAGASQYRRSSRRARRCASGFGRTGRRPPLS